MPNNLYYTVKITNPNQYPLTRVRVYFSLNGGADIDISANGITTINTGKTLPCSNTITVKTKTIATGVIETVTFTENANSGNVLPMGNNTVEEDASNPDYFRSTLFMIPPNT
jgi:hypothetical protein